MTISGVDVAHPQPGQNHPVPWLAGYRSNVFVASFSFGARLIDFSRAGPDEPGVVRFAAPDASGVAVADLVDRTKLELISTPNGQLRSYHHRTGTHVFAIDFEPPLPAPHQVSNSVASIFRISIDEFRDLSTGRVDVTKRDPSIVIDWRFETPEWAQDTPLQTTVASDTAGRMRITLDRAPGQR